MEEDKLKLYLQHLKQYVIEETKIVTFKWLSRELNVHVNLAKDLLSTFLNQHHGIVHATYLLIGLLLDEVTHKILIVQEDDLEKAKLQFKVLSSEHIYSIQKPKEIAGLSCLYIIDRYCKDDSSFKRLNTVCCNEAVERDADEIAKLKIKVRDSAASTDISSWPAAQKKMTSEVSKENDTMATTSEEKVATEVEKEVIQCGVTISEEKTVGKIEEKNKTKSDITSEEKAETKKEKEDIQCGIATISEEKIASQEEEENETKSNIKTSEEKVASEEEKEEIKSGIEKVATNEVEKERNSGLATTFGEEIVTKEGNKDKKSGGIDTLFAALDIKPIQQINRAEKRKADEKPASNWKSSFDMFFNTEKPKEKSEQSVLEVGKNENRHEELVCDEAKSSGSEISSKWRSKSEPVVKEKKVYSMKHSAEQPKNKRKATDDLPPSKRKRIVYVSNSEDSDDDIYYSDDEEEPMNSPLQVQEPVLKRPVESDDDVIPLTAQGENKYGNKQECKMQVSTFMDDDGYVVTKREYVVESCTDNEGEEKKKKIKREENNSEDVKDEENSSTSEPPEKKKRSIIKQPTLEYFFKKQ